MRVLICGGTGFVGGNLVKYFKKQGANVELIERDDLANHEQLTDLVSGSDVVINVAGASIARRWSRSYKREIYESRIDVAQRLVAAINSAEKRPKLYIGASAVGYYRAGVCADEARGEMGDGFLARLCRDWEQASEPLAQDVRRVVMRMGVVLSPAGGAYAQVFRMARWGFVASIGRGSQRISWISVEDLVRAYWFTVERKELSGVVNCVAPDVVTSAESARIMAEQFRAMRLRVPTWAIRMAMGQGACVVTDDVCVWPEVLLGREFEFGDKSFLGYVQRIDEGIDKK